MEPIATHYIHPTLHAVFGEFFGTVIYDGIWVGRESDVPNIDGLRADVVAGCREAGITAFRWPGGMCADHYHWLDGVGPRRWDRIHPVPFGIDTWRNDFGTDEFVHFCRLIHAEPILIANVATGTPVEFLDWFEYCNGGTNTRYGAMRAENGHPEPYNITTWGLGNTDENVWHIDFNHPVAYAQDYMRFRTAVLGLAPRLKLIGLGLSERHNTPGWVEGFLDHVTHRQTAKGPDSLSIHHYIGGAKTRYERCEGALDYSDEAYYYTLDAVAAYQKDIDLHRAAIAEHTSARFPTTICFDEWGLWHPEATHENGVRQPQTMRDALFAALALHTFYRNSDIVQYAMETQVCNLLQSLFETDGPRFYRTPTFHVMRLFRDHLGQTLLDWPGQPDDPMLDCLASVGAGGRVTVTLVNKDLRRERDVRLPGDLLDGRRPTRADTIAPGEVRARNTFDCPDAVQALSFILDPSGAARLAPHSVTRIVLEPLQHQP